MLKTLLGPYGIRLYDPSCQSFHLVNEKMGVYPFSKIRDVSRREKVDWGDGQTLRLKMRHRADFIAPCGQ